MKKAVRKQLYVHAARPMFRAGLESGATASPHNPLRLLLKSKYRVVLLSAFFSYMSFGLLFQIFPPFLPAIQHGFDIDHAAASLVMTVFLIPMAAAAIPSGSIADHWGVRATGVTGLSVMALGSVITMFSASFALLLAGRAVSGFGAALLLVSILKLLTSTIPAEQHGIAFGLFVAGLPVGTGISFDLLSSFRTILGWRGENAIATAVIIAALILYWLAARSRGVEHYQSATSVIGILRNRGMPGLLATVILGYTAIIGFTTWAPSTLVSYAHISIWLASVIASILLLIDIPLSPLFGSLSDRLNRRKLFVVLAFLIYALASLFVPIAATSPSWLVGLALIAVISIMGGGCAMFFPSALTIPAKNLPAGDAGKAYGLFFTAQIVGMTLGPILIGYSLDAGPSYAGFLTVTVITFLGLLASLMIIAR